MTDVESLMQQYRQYLKVRRYDNTHVNRSINFITNKLLQKFSLDEIKTTPHYHIVDVICGTDITPACRNQYRQAVKRFQDFMKTEEVF